MTTILGIAFFVGTVALSVYSASSLNKTLDEYEKNIKDIDLFKNE
jgi:preprotein translocase subunit SecG